MHAKRSLAFVVTTFFALPAIAADDDWGRSGLYVLAGTSVASELNFEESAAQLFGTVGRVDSAVGVQGRLGFRALPWLAAEAQYDWVPGFDFKTSAAGKLSDGTTWMVSANAKLYPQPDERFQLFAIVGVGYMRTENQVVNGPTVTAGDFAARIGGGLDAHFDRHWLVSVEAVYVPTTGQISAYDNMTIGLGVQYRF